MHATLAPPNALSTNTTPTFKVLGIRVDAVQIPDAVGILEQWIADRQGSRFVAVTGMHGVSESLSDEKFRTILGAAGMVVSEGMPLVWLGRFYGPSHTQRRGSRPHIMDKF